MLDKKASNSDPHAQKSNFDIQGVFLTGPPDFQYQNEKQVAARTSFSQNFQCKKAPHWLSKFFSFWY